MHLVPKLIVLLLLLDAGSAIAMEDKPALTDRERAVLNTSIGAGFLGGLYGGYLSRRPLREIYERGAKKNEIAHANTLSATESKKYLDAKERKFKWHQSGVLPALGLAGGGMAGYLLAIYGLAKKHNVTFKVQQMSLDYDINLEQYGSMLMAAQRKDIKVLQAAINTLYAKRFGHDWHARMIHFFKENDGKYISLHKNRSKLDRDKKDFVRMIELGAALETLYYNSDPSPFDTKVGRAIKMYQLLGLLK